MTIERPPWSKRSLTAQAMGHVDPITKAIVPPIHVATTYIRDEDNAYSSGFVYGRPDNATIREAEGVIAMLEDAPAGALLFSSGMAAATAVFQALDPGDHVVAPKVMYWALRNWLATETRRAAALASISSRRTISTSCAGRRARQRTKLVWIETPVEPALDDHRHRRGGRDRPRGRRAPRGRFDLRLARSTRGRWRSAPTS